MRRRVASGYLSFPGWGLVLLTLVLSSAFAADWPHWRGPAFDGSSPERQLPAAFSKTNQVKWIAPLPGPSAATPVVVGDRVFISSTDPQSKTLLALALDRRTGKPLWQHRVASGYTQDERSNLASPSPVTDGECVWFFYGTGDLAAFDADGQRLWTRNLQRDYGPFAILWTYGGSPLWHDGRLYLQVLQRNVPVGGRGRTDGPNDSYLLALDPRTGKELWRHIRPSDAREESLEAFSTPIPYTHADRTEILVTGGDHITGHDPVTGRELWRWGSWNPNQITSWRVVPSPVAGAGVVLACAPKAAPVYAVKLGGRGRLADSELAWKSTTRPVSSDVCTPLFYQDRFYVLNGERRALSRIVPATGAVEWTGELGRGAKIETSPTGADGKIYFMDHRATVQVVEAGPAFKILHTVNLGDEGEDNVRSSIAVARGNLFIRTNRKLFCVGS
ncbi:MAG: PQQ-binding-like beta-propeller repeat protein [Verrucomicrobia bacterium]|nr:PQQ-binding-like beta-propeller repeat protein [Verrucomicrobiota bacterium]